MKQLTMTLQKRLMSEARAKFLNFHEDLVVPEDKVSEFKSFEEYVMDKEMEFMDQIILHTIEQTIKEGCEVVEGMKQALFEPPDNYENNNPNYQRVRDNEQRKIDISNQVLTDTQHALRGIIK